MEYHINEFGENALARAITNKLIGVKTTGKRPGLMSFSQGVRRVLPVDTSGLSDQLIMNAISEYMTPSTPDYQQYALIWGDKKQYPDFRLRRGM